MSRHCLISLGCLLLLLLTAFAFSAEPVKTNPYTRPEDVEEGQLYVRAFCARCHGIDATGARGPDLTRGRWGHGEPDADILNTIKSGGRGTDMPGEGNDSDEKINGQMDAFIKPRRKGQPAEKVDGDSAKGKTLFARHNCASCHW